jgi:arginase
MIYVHVDMDVLDPAEVGGHPLTVPGGPASDHLAATLRPVFEIEQVVALGIASTPPEDRDPDGLARRAACRLVAAAGGHSNRSPN